MQDRLTARLASLREEYRTGQNMLADLEAKELDVRQTLLRIEGAIQVLEELLAAEPSKANGDRGPAAEPPHPPPAAAAPHPDAETAPGTSPRAPRT